MATDRFQVGPIVVLGAGINGAAIARELTLQGAEVLLVDAEDVAGGTTSYSSRLIHGGLRYLEYAEISLVRESLTERDRLLRLAPELVRPLELVIPVGNRLSGLISGAQRFFFKSGAAPKDGRGSLVVRLGLTLYDRFASGAVPGHRRLSSAQFAESGLSTSKFFTAFSYFDGQLTFPEQFALSLVQDAQAAAKEQGGAFSLRTYQHVRREAETLFFSSIHPNHGAGEIAVTPAAVINAAGPWVDTALAGLNVPSNKLIGGTKGSHLITRAPDLCKTIGPRGVYAEASDGRPIFILPWNNACLIGTTDIRYDGDPADAVADQEEIDYLIDATNAIFPDVGLTRDDIQQHYCGVRPLPAAGEGATSSITRSHVVHRHSGSPFPLYSIIGGKLTTCRSLAEGVVKAVLPDLGHEVARNSRERPLPPPNFGETPADAPLLPDLDVPIAHASYAIEHLAAKTLADLVERRLMIVFDPKLSRSCLRVLAEQLATAGWLDQAQIDAEVDHYVHRLQERYGKRVS
ncbi:glycerol-3-phosphate dehydrogenase/oxidase [Blastopirellula retiformator]|uniref:Aerobic glycerol-3-phosphate dehydrogenase n=1 Tax=Blastopirellula retiformator TaxID=2527970 RepID=A0A5C5V104_9BACT|nr:glycerol-3-phosphate dehydrogenase/oxidase [Blastopirellula retiformator]TWT31477.1 Aerobic glycerol-3-phosphate dehydrogenase [Blastopirellula retiformator]